MQIQLTTPISAPSLQTQEGSPLSLLRPGTSFSATVTGVEGKNVQLTMENGAAFTARQESVELLHPGDTVTIQVSASEATGSSVSLKLVDINGQAVLPDQATGTELQLMHMQIAPTPANMAHAAVLTRMGLPVTPDSVARFTQVTAQLPQLTPEQGALFACSSLPVAEQTANTFLQCLQSPQQAAVVLETLTQYAAEHLPQTAGLYTLLQENATQDNPTSFLPAMQGSETPVAQAAIHNFPAAATPESAQPLSTSVAAEDIFLDSAAPPTDAQTQAAPQTLSANADIPQAAPQTLSAAIDAALAAASRLTGEPVTSPSLQGQQQIPVAEEASVPILPGTEPPVSEAARAITAVLQEDAPMRQGAALQESAAKLPEKLLRVLTSVLSETTRPQGGEAKIAHVAEQTGVLINQLQLGAETAPVAYLQIPVQYQEQKQTAELYVLRRHNGKDAVDESNATVAICLDTEHLGRVETVLTAVQNTLTLDFRAETERAAAVLREQLPNLYSAAFPARYQLANASVGLIRERITPLNAAKQLTPERPAAAAAGLDISI